MGQSEYQPVFIEDEERGERIYIVDRGRECFSIMCGLIASIVLIILIGVMIYYFSTPSIANKK